MVGLALESRAALARAFLATAVSDVSTTRALVEWQGLMTLEEQLADLQKARDLGVVAQRQGYKRSGIGYKLHIDAIDRGLR